MASYRIVWKKSSEHDIRKIDKKHIPRIVKAIETLLNNPFPVQSKKLRDSEASYRLRVGEYRVIYQFDPREKLITIYHIRHRKDAYKL